MDNQYRGVQITESGSIRIWFKYEGKRIFEPLNLSATAANLKHASKLRADIVQRIKLGVFDYPATFPDSPRCKKAPEEIPAVFDVALRWLEVNKHLARSTLLNYRKIANRYLMPTLGTRQIHQVKTSDLMKIITDNEWSSNKTRNNVISAIRGIFEIAVLDGHITSNPAGNIKFAKVQKPPADPLSMDEVQTVLNYLHKKMPEWKTYFQLAFFTGLRSSELIALRWEDIDWNMQLLRIQRAYVQQQIKGTKTAKIRDIELNQNALEALTVQKSKTFLANEWVFLHPTTGKQINDHKPPRLAWDRVLKATGIRHRNAYQTRHTFATLNLMAGANPMWVAQQMGHSSMKMILDHYARWIQSADMGRNKALLDSAFTDTAKEIAK